MSDYFKNKNDGREFGPAPLVETLWLIVDPVNEDLTKCCTVYAKTAFFAKQAAAKYMGELSNKAVVFPGVEFLDFS